METTEKGKIHKISMLTLGLLIDIKERIGSLVRLWGGKAQPKFEQPTEETPGYEGILPVSENSSHSWEMPSTQLSSDSEVSEQANLQPSYTIDNPKGVSGEFMEEDKEPWEDQDPSTDHDIPLRPSEVEIPHEIQYDREDDSQILDPDKGESEVVIPEEDIEVENPDKKEIDPERLVGNRKFNKRNTNR